MSSHGPPFARTALQGAFKALYEDLADKDGPRISTMRNYRFAIVCYSPNDEFALRAEASRLSFDLQAAGWVVLSISLQRLLLDRVRGLGDGQIKWLMDEERCFAEYDKARGLHFLAEELAPLIEGKDGLAADCARIIHEHVLAHPHQAERTVVLIGRAGSLYPFFRSSALLRHLDGHTDNLPVVLLYPGQRSGQSGLSFMGMFEPDSDYRPRIYA